MVEAPSIYECSMKAVGSESTSSLKRQSIIHRFRLNQVRGPTRKISKRTIASDRHPVPNPPRQSSPRDRPRLVHRHRRFLKTLDEERKERLHQLPNRPPNKIQRPVWKPSLLGDYIYG